MSFKSWLADLLGVRPVERIIYNGTPIEVPKYIMVEVPLIRTQQGWDKDARETVATLAAHPGWLLLKDRLTLQAQTLKTKLSFDRHANIRDVEFLQSGVFWCNWLQNQIANATTRTAVRRQEATDEDLAAIKELESTYEKVGAE